MKKFLRSVIAIHNIEGKLGKWPGPIIDANSFEVANDWCKKNTKYLIDEQEIIKIMKQGETSIPLNLAIKIFIT